MHLVVFIIRIYHDARSPERLYSRNKFEKSVHLVGFIIRIYHDARSPERLYSKNKFEKSVHLVGFIIRIYHDARSPERLYSKNKFEKSVHLVVFIIRIYHDARSPERHIRTYNVHELVTNSESRHGEGRGWARADHNCLLYKFLLAAIESVYGMLTVTHVTLIA